MSRMILRKYLFLVGALVVISIACNLSSISVRPGGGQSGEDTPSQDVISLESSQEVEQPTTPPTKTIAPTWTPYASPTLKPSWTPLPSRTLRPTWTPSPTLSPTATPEVAPILKEDFSDPMTPWLKTAGTNYKMGIAKGMYFMTISDFNVEITSSRTWLKLAEVRIEADIKFHSGGGYYGFSCRESSSNYYTLFISSDGHYGLGQTRNGKVDFFEYRKSPVVKTGSGATNHVAAECRGNTLKLYVNDQLLAQRVIEGLGPGYVGMMAGTTTDKDSLTVYFDNLVIWGP